MSGIDAYTRSADSGVSFHDRDDGTDDARVRAKPPPAVEEHEHDDGHGESAPALAPHSMGASLRDLMAVQRGLQIDPESPVGPSST